ncbi:MAG: 3-hydroxyacyl-CoA dehydrogenase NAD-binding domain-containing protein [Candidatus Thiodiazotropha endolucinida]
MQIKQVAVLGAGVMGSGIAAQVANAGIQVILLDIVSKDTDDRDALANSALKKQLKAGGFMQSENAKLVVTGNLEDDIILIAEADLIIEVVIEQLDIKQSLYRRIDALRKPGSIVTSNTSTIPLANLVEGQSDNFIGDFAITHFFNPPRHMRLLELVVSDQTRPEVVSRINRFFDEYLGKRVVVCKDTPGFIANRIGIFWLQTALHEAINLGISVEEADKLIGKAFGIPATGVFGLFDLVGIDIMPKIADSMAATLNDDDAFHTVAKTPALIEMMIETGYTGRKGKGGFYRVTRTEQGKLTEVRDLTGDGYRAIAKSDLESIRQAVNGDARLLISNSDRGGQYAWRVMGRTLAYAASLVPEISDDVASVDTAMKLGYAWQYGPFELIDQLDAGWFAWKLAKEGESIPDLIRYAAHTGFYQIIDRQRNMLGHSGVYVTIQQNPDFLSLTDVKLAGTAIESSNAASLWDLGDGVACLEFRTKGNAVDSDLLRMIGSALTRVESEFKAMVIYNEGRQFCSGANLAYALDCIDSNNFKEMHNFVSFGQKIYTAMKMAPFPVVGAPSGMALGGGCEVLLACDVVQAHAETYMGLVEPTVGFVPAWGGCKELLLRWTASSGGEQVTPEIAGRVFDIIAAARPTGSAVQARSSLLLQDHDGITMNRERLLADAKARALKMVEDYTPSSVRELDIQGVAVRESLLSKIADSAAAGTITEYDQVVLKALAQILSANGENRRVNEQDLLELELGNFIHLTHEAGTRARIEHMMKTRKPLRN